MSTITLSPEILADKVRNFTGPSPFGVSCRFINLDSQWGIKVYHYSNKRDEAYDRQKAMAACDCGPQVGIKFDAGEGNYCYISQVAMLVATQNENGGYGGKLGDISMNPIFQQLRTNLLKKMSDNGYDMTDCHAGNFGYLENKLVCIDFGNE